MGQYWELVNIDRQERLLNNGWLKLRGLLAERSLEQLVELIQTPKWIPLGGPTYNVQVSKSNSTRSSLLGLPQEVIDMIVGNLSRDSPESVIYLSLTCVYFFRLLGPAFQRVLAEDTAPWAGDRLVFVGDYANGLDVGGICTNEELRRFEETHGEEYHNNPLYYISDDRVMCAKNEPYRKRRGVPLRYLREDDLRRAGALEQRARENLMLDDLQLFDRLTAIAKRAQLGNDDRKQAPVLRNLTAKKYVRDDAVAESDYAYSLGEVVAVLTTWTADPSGTEGLDNIGEWAGHRFDIATMADVPEKDGWAEVSQLAVQRLQEGSCEKRKTGKRAWLEPQVLR